MIKKLSTIGDGLGIKIEGPILELLRINEDTELEVNTDGDVLVIRPIRQLSHREKVLAAAHEMMDLHEETFRKLAE